MANSNAGNSPKFWQLFSSTFRTFFGNLGSFGPLFLAFWASMFLVQLSGHMAGVTGVGLYGKIDYGFNEALKGAFMLIYFILTVFVSVVMSLGLIKMALGFVKGKKVGLVESISFGLKNFWHGLWIGIRVTWYTFKWPFLIIAVVLILFGVLSGFAVANMAGAEEISNGALIETAYEAGDIDALAELTKDVKSSDLKAGDLDAFFADTEGPSSITSVATMILGGLGIIGILTFLIFGIWRGVRLYFSTYGFVDKGKKSWDALQHSMDTVKGHFWLVLFYLLFFGILMALIFIFPLSFVYNPMFKGGSVVLALVIQNFGSTLMAMLLSVFAASLYTKLSK